MKTVKISSLLILSGLLLGACAQSNNTTPQPIQPAKTAIPSSTATPSPSTMPSSTEMPSTVSELPSSSVSDTPSDTADSMVFEYSIEMFGFGYNPDVLTVKAGSTLKITTVSLDMLHDFVVDDLDIATDKLKGGETNTFEFQIPADAAGTYEFYCSVGDHRAEGMVGTLIVE